VRNGFISVSEAKAAVEELRVSGYRMSGEILKNFFAIIEGLEGR